MQTKTPTLIHRKKLFTATAISIFIFTALVALVSAVYLIQKPKNIKISEAVLAGDCDGNGTVNILDFQLLSNSFGKSSGQTGYDSRCDFDGSNSINILDFQILSNNFGKSGVTPTPGAGITLSVAADTFVSSQNTSRNYGGNTTAISSDFDSNLRTAYLKFNVGSITNIQSAELRLTASLDRAIEKKLYTSSSSWSESTINYTNKPSVGTNQIGYINRLGNALSVGEVLSIPLDAAKLSPDSNGNITIVVDSAGSNNTFSFYTKESGNNPPQLVIK